MRRFLRSLFAGKNSTQSNIQRINTIRAELASRTEEELRGFGQRVVAPVLEHAVGALTGDARHDG